MKFDIKIAIASKIDLHLNGTTKSLFELESLFNNLSPLPFNAMFYELMTCLHELISNTKCKLFTESNHQEISRLTKT